jgi:uncharacterized protein YceH (UPF0502 family)
MALSRYAAATLSTCPLISAVPSCVTLIVMQLNHIQLRVLGALIEKEITTPENYPLSLNALINACNQRSSRDPVLDLDEESVRQALNTLQDLGLTAPYRDARVTKYEHRARTVLNLRRDETAVLCLLLLRGPQTPGELRSRADRMFTFDDLAAVISTLDRLAARPAVAQTSITATEPTAADSNATGPLTILLPRQPGSREARYAHLLGDPASLKATQSASDAAGFETSQIKATQRVDLEAQLESLRVQFHALEQRILALESAAIPTSPALSVS